MVLVTDCKEYFQVMAMELEAALGNTTWPSKLRPDSVVIRRGKFLAEGDLTFLGVSAITGGAPEMDERIAQEGFPCGPLFVSPLLGGRGGSATLPRLYGSWGWLWCKDMATNIDAAVQNIMMSWHRPEDELGTCSPYMRATNQFLTKREGCPWPARSGLVRLVPAK